MAPKRIVTVLALVAVVVSILTVAPSNLVRPIPVAFARDVARSSSGHPPCVPVGGALTTNIGAIAGVTNLGPVFGDLAGSVAATILGQNGDGSFNVQHYWVTAGGDTITLAANRSVPTYPTSR